MNLKKRNVNICYKKNYNAGTPYNIIVSDKNYYLIHLQLNMMEKTFTMI